MIIKELFEGPVGDYCIAHNTIKCLLAITLVIVIPLTNEVNQYILTKTYMASERLVLM